MKLCPVCGTEYGDDASFCSRDRAPLQAAESRDQPGDGLVGQLVGERYQVERRIGEGGMGEVYLARHVLIGRPCALKVMSRSVSRDPDAVTRFNREATSASRISHPNVCTVYDFGLTGDGLVYLAMEYVEGRTLRSLLEASGPLTLPRAAELLRQCAAGLSAAHELGIVHRDLKPDNIMVVPTREGETVKLVDFGIAKAVETPAAERVTRSGFVVGTPEYMSPEQLSGDPVDTRSDQYGLALVFYRMITGALPFQGSSLQETLTKRLTDPPRPLAEARPGAQFPPALQLILDRALSRQAGERYGSVRELSDAVAEVVRSLGAAGPGADAQPTRRLPAPASRGSRVTAAFAGILLISAGAWGVVKLLGRTPAPESPPDSARVQPPAAPAPVPAASPLPAPPPPSRPEVAVDSGDLDIAALDSLPARRQRELDRADRQLHALWLSARKRAVAAAFLGTAALDAGLRDSARVLYRMAWRLDRNPRYLENLRQMGDTIQP